MNRYDMQDLIIEDEEFKEKKPKKVIAILALIIIILLVGTLIMKYVIGDEKIKDRNESIKKNKIVSKSDNELAPIHNRAIEINPQKNRHHNINEKNSNLIQEDELSELIPINGQKIKEKAKNIEVENKNKHITDIIQTNDLEKERVENKKDITIAKLATKNEKNTKLKSDKRVKKSNKINKNNKRVHKIHKSSVVSHKSNKLFKKRHTTSVDKKQVNGIYYIQVGSFAKQPNRAYLENIRKHKYKFKLFKSRGLTKVRIGPYTNYEFAKSKLPTIKKDLGISGFVVRVK